MNSDFVISIIVPMLNEASQLPELLDHLSLFAERQCEIILVDGGSVDNSVALATQRGFRVLLSEKGRAVQMNFGANAAQGDTLVFLHADTRLPANADLLIKESFLEPTYDWGRFDVLITGGSFMFKVISWFMNKRSALSSIVTGDQAIFVRRSAFLKLGGFPVQPLMEDIEFSKQMKHISKAAVLHEKVTTSGRRWEQRGIWRTIILMWRLRFDYWLGQSPESIAKRYR